MKKTVAAGFVLLMLVLSSANQQMQARVITQMPVVSVTPCGIDAAVLCIDLNNSPPACSFPFGAYANSPDYGPDFYVGFPCANRIIPAAAVGFPCTNQIIPAAGVIVR